MKNSTETKPSVSATEEDEQKQQKPFVPPKLERHEKLPVVTAGSITAYAWGFDNAS